MDGVFPPCSRALAICKAAIPFHPFFFPECREFGPPHDGLLPMSKKPGGRKPFHLLHACRYQRETANHHPQHREGGIVHSLCWPGLQTEGNLVMRTHQTIINKQSSLCLIFLLCLEKFPRDRKGCSAGTWSVVLFKRHQFNLMESGVLSVTGTDVKDGFSTLLPHGALHLSQKTQPRGSDSQISHQENRLGLKKHGNLCYPQFRNRL